VTGVSEVHDGLITARRDDFHLPTREKGFAEFA
jgi:hypothetical protein